MKSDRAGRGRADRSRPRKRPSIYAPRDEETSEDEMFLKELAPSRDGRLQLRPEHFMEGE